MKTSGSVGDELPVGSREFCYLCVHGVALGFVRRMMNESRGAGISAVRTDTQTQE